MSILSGFKKYKDYILTSSGYQLSSRWTKSDAVVMGDGTDDTNTLEKNLGSIQGITDSLTATSSNIALSAKGASDMYNELNSNLNAKLDKSGSEQLKVNRDTATFREAYNNAAVVITGNVPAIGFHNPGIEGAALYLQNGKLFLLFNNGDAYTLDMTYFTHTDV